MSRLRPAGRLLIIVGLAGGCRTVGPPPDMTPITEAAAVAPTAPGRFDLRWLSASTDTMIMTRAGEAQPVATSSSPARIVVGMTIESVRHTREHGGRRLLEVSFEERDTLSTVTSTITQVDALSLVPVRQRATLPDGRVATLIYAGGAIDGIDSVPGSPVRFFTAPVPDSAYTSGAIDLVLRALPLTDGYRTTVPFYFPADQILESLPVRVAGQERISTRAGRVADCWLVAVEFPDGVTEHFWIDQRSHALLRILAHDGPMSLIRYDR
jgi:hypothetical protein